jgi:hypothetical protein
MKKTNVLLCCILLSGFAGTASGTAPIFSVNVPEAWSVGLVSPDGACTVTVIAERDDGALTLEQQVLAIARSLDGGAPQQIAEQQYIFYYEVEGQPHRGLVLRREGAFYFISVSGDHPDLTGVLNSIASRTLAKEP